MLEILKTILTLFKIKIAFTFTFRPVYEYVSPSKKNRKLLKFNPYFVKFIICFRRTLRMHFEIKYRPSDNFSDSINFSMHSSRNEHMQANITFSEYL